MGMADTKYIQTCIRRKKQKQLEQETTSSNDEFDNLTTYCCCARYSEKKNVQGTPSRKNAQIRLLLFFPPHHPVYGNYSGRLGS